MTTEQGVRVASVPRATSATMAGVEGTPAERGLRLRRYCFARMNDLGLLPLSGRHLAELLGVKNDDSVSRWFRGEVEPSTPMFRRLADLFDEDVSVVVAIYYGEPLALLRGALENLSGLSAEQLQELLSRSLNGSPREARALRRARRAGRRPTGD